MRTTVKLIVTNEANVSQSSFVLQFPEENHLDIFVETMLKGASICNAVIIPELNTYGVKLNGVPIQKSNVTTEKKQ